MSALKILKQTTEQWTAGKLAASTNPKSFLEITVEMAALGEIIGIESPKLARAVLNKADDTTSLANTFSDLFKQFATLYFLLASTTDEKKDSIQTESKNCLNIIAEFVPFLDRAVSDPNIGEELHKLATNITDSFTDLNFLLDVEQRSATVQQIDHCVIKVDLYINQSGLKVETKLPVTFHSQNTLYFLREFATTMIGFMKKLLAVEQVESTDEKNKLKAEVVTGSNQFSVEVIPKVLQNVLLLASTVDKFTSRQQLLKNAKDLIQAAAKLLKFVAYCMDTDKVDDDIGTDHVKTITSLIQVVINVVYEVDPTQKH